QHIALAPPRRRLRRFLPCLPRGASPFPRRHPLAQYGEPGASVFSALVVVAGGGQQRGPMPGRPTCVAHVERLDVFRENGGVRTNFVARKQRPIAIEHRILERLCRQRRGQLLEAPHRLVSARGPTWRTSAA